MMAKLTDVARAVDVGLTILAHRVLTILALFMVFGLFCVAMSQASWLHLAISGGFGIIVFLPVLYVDRRPKEAAWQSEPAQ
jgi:hypothetical protein